jgi:hypothetical protein
LGALAVLSIAGYFIAGAMIRRKVDAALEALPPGIRASYTTLHFDLLGSSMNFEGVSIRDSADGYVYEASIGRVGLRGIHFLEMMRTGHLKVGRLDLEDIKAREQKMKLAFEGNVELDSVYGSKDGGKGFGALRFRLSRVDGRIPRAEERVVLKNLEFDSRGRRLRLDTLRVEPVLDPEKMGRERGQQVDVYEVTSTGIDVEGLDWEGLRDKRFDAERVTVKHNRIHVFRDRRLPLEPGGKPMPVQSLKELPIGLRVGSVHLGPSTFIYEEFPKDGEKTGRLIIGRMKMNIEPLINRPVHGDPAYLTLYTEGSLMNSGTVDATTKMPLHKGDPYRVEGTFHDLDLTQLNNPAENLGKLHLESGMLNQLDFHFEMNDERATGEVTGRYHQLVADKLKKNGKTDAVKSFALKHLIIPKNKEKARGKVDYKRDAERYFSYYLLHSLLVGVKSSFSLGFLLPG